MASRKAAAAAADAQKKRKREKVEDAGRSKKRKPQDEKSEKSKTAIVVKQSGKVLKPAEARHNSRPTSWKLSEPMGGCMSDIDPIFTPDEQRLIIAYRTSIQVYSTADSLLERRIKLPQQDGAAGRASRIVGAVLSPLSDELVWVGCADGSVFRVNRSSGAVERLGRKQEPAPKLVGMAVELVQMGKEKREVLFLSEGARGAWQVTAYDAGGLAKSVGRTLFSHSGTTAIEHLRTASDGRIVVGVSGKTVFVGGLQLADGQTPKTVAELAYQFFSVDTADEVSCLDLRTTTKKKGTALDLVLGCARGAIYVYGDVLNRLKNATAEGSRSKNKNTGIHPRKCHWHSRSVYAVKWSRDGNYFISGGAETVLVLWQTDTGRLSFLPHLAASIENIVVSPRGSSYAIHLDDNSAMVVSTAEMKPTCYVSGLQSLAFAETPRKDAHVRRAWRPVESITQPVPAVISPTDPSRILLRAGNGLKGTMTGESPSASLLQTFDISAFQSLAKQPLARTNPTDANLTLRGHPVTEPTITHLCASHDGRWLVSVDEWQPPPRDISGIAGEPSLQDDWARERREIHLKFWAVEEAESDGGSSSSELPSYELVSRVDEAHYTTQVEPIFGVAADSGRPNRFATLGDDAVVRFWGLRQRVRDGLAAVDERGRALVSWHCTQEAALPLGEGGGSKSVAGRNGLVAQEPKTKTRRCGALTFSEDGSTVFAAFGAPGEAVLYTIDAESGDVRASLPDMFRGDVRAVQSLGATLILLSEDLRVYDIVADELRYGVRLLGHGGGVGAEDEDREKKGRKSSKAALAESAAYSALTQLVVGRQSQTFAVSVPHAPAAPWAASRPQSRLLVFSPEHAQPLLVEELPHLVVSLLPAVGLSGFLAIDSAAQIWSVVDAADTAVLGQPLSDLNLPMTTAAAGKQQKQKQLQLTNGVEEGDKEMPDVVGAAEDAAGEEEEEEEEDGEDEEEKKEDDEDDDDDTYAAVIAPQKLRDIFDAAPATSASIEELFWQVSGLLSALPQLVPAGRS